MVSFIRSDLEFILQQIVIAERHAAGESLVDILPNVFVSFGLRTVDGTFNNLVPGQEQFGAADQPFPELLEQLFRNEQDENPFFGISNTDYGLDDNVVDSDPRIISNLIADQTIRNPAAVQAFVDGGFGIVVDGVLHYLNEDGTPGDVVPPDVTLTVPNTAPDAGLSAGFNSWFVFFGQFFDHGLDFIQRSTEMVVVPLQPDDPLYVEGSPTNFMVIERTIKDETGAATNLTTPFVDQNQTYASHAAHQVFLREYELDDSGRPVATGRLIEGASGGMSTWADVKAQARDLLGIELTDADVGRVPLVLTDAYGNFIPGEDGRPQLIADVGPPPVFVARDPVTGLAPASQALATGHAFIIDIAHNAAPGTFDHDNDPSTPPIAKVADADDVAGPVDAVLAPGEYDDELLDAHYMAGDGRANENIALTAVHHVFHSEHNRLVDHTKAVILEAGDLAFLNQWLATPLAAFPTTQAEIDALEWNGERLFQAARFGTEMQYQHLVFEEFARKVQPNVDAFLAPGYDATIDPAIVAEFAHTVYRFGHSMLTDTVDRLDPNFVSSQMGLIEAFLNPLAFDENGSLTPEEAAGAIVRGTTRQLGNEIDEFVTESLRNNLLGLPLDLAAINLARGRETGVPTLNAARADFYDMTGDSQLEAYTSWADFAANLKHPESIINFIAAYGTHTAITSVSAFADKRAAAALLVMGDGDDSDGVTINGVTYTDRFDFLGSTGAWANGAGLPKDLDGATTTGLGNVDLWIGGLAEKQMPFGGLLGSTFNFVFETQLEALQNGDRFYYLARVAGLNFLNELENNSFAKLIMANTDAKHLPADVFSTPTWILEVDPTQQFTGLGPDGRADPTEGGTELRPLVIRDNPETEGPDTNYLQYTGVDHVVLGGTEGDDILVGSIGDDTLWGDGGNDRLEGGDGVDNIEGGAGDDIITDLGGDDVLKGGDGNDVIHGGNGFNLIIGGAGKDFIITGEDVSETFAGQGDDFILGAKTNLPTLGNEGDDWIEIGTQDGAPGDNFDELANDLVSGNDIFVGGGGFDEMLGEGGDDIFVGSEGEDHFDGDSGFDWVTFKNDTRGVTADMLVSDIIEPPVAPSNAGILDRYGFVEGLSGSSFSDVLRGDDADAADIAAGGAQGSVLDQAGIDLISGLQSLLGEGVTSFGAGNIILGGDGSDIIEGRGGNDIIDGDRWLNVRISVRANDDGTGAEIASFNSMTELVPLMLNGTYNPGQLVAVREILEGNGGFDTALFSGPSANYTIITDDNGTPFNGTDDFVTVIDNVGTDGTDRLINIERLQFSDGTIVLAPGLNEEPTGQLQILDVASGNPDNTPVEGQLLRASIAGVTDADNPGGTITGPVSYVWQVETVPGTGIYDDIVIEGGDKPASATGDRFVVPDGLGGQAIRVKATYQDANGVLETVFSAPTQPVVDVPPVATDPLPAESATESTGVHFIRSDLQFILDQIRIAERHAAGEDLADILPNSRVAFGLRTVDGSFNNLVPGQEQFGASDENFPLLLDQIFRNEGDDAFGPVTNNNYATSGPGASVVDADPRLISNLIVDQTLNNPAAIAAALRAAGSENVEADTAAVRAALQAIEDAEAAGAPNLTELQQAFDELAADLGLEIVASPGLDGVFGTEDDKDVLFIGNVAADEGLSAGFNAWMTFFGQFFDHGLDLVDKGGSGTIFIPLQPDDPLYVEGSPTNFMLLTRATNTFVGAGNDGQFGTADDVHFHNNETTPFVDQNQTYTSNPSHQVFLREYVLVDLPDDGIDGPVPVNTGRLLEGADGGLATWADIKQQARTILGINLTDADVANVPGLLTDPYGNFIPGANGFPQLVTSSGVIEGDPTANGGLGVTIPANAGRTGHAFLDDIAHSANPRDSSGALLAADADDTVGDDGVPATYDDELLDAHYITGDGRGNENIGLTTVHHVFHSEHNRLAEHIKDVVLASNDLSFINEWLLIDLPAGTDLPVDDAAARAALIAQLDAASAWDGERLFQAARFGTEMQYQHLVFEEFARKIQPQVDIFFAATQVYDTGINPAILAEFAHVVYRFGHSMLTETIDRYDPAFNVIDADPLHPGQDASDHQIGLIAAFLNPLAFAAGGATAEEQAGAIVRGVTRQLGNEIDEFVTEALRNNLVGLPLDLPAINIARGRDAGVPPLNKARAEFYEMTGDSQLKPYTSWADFGANIKHFESLVNFIAAYGTHETITGATTLEAKRAAAYAIVYGESGMDGLPGTGDEPTAPVPADRMEFLTSTGAWANSAARPKDVDGFTNTGLGNVDLWIGGLAERKMPFGGFLGSTFNFVFETQMETLQDGDRFYYLERTASMSFLNELENNTFAKIIMANTDAKHLPADVFSTPAWILEVDQPQQFTGLGANGRADPEGEVIRNNPATTGTDTNYLEYTGEEHVVLGGTDPGNTANPSGNDILIASIGDDTVYGDGGNDRIEGGDGNDFLQGGAGDDIITDKGGDDNIQGGDGNDVIHGGNGINLLLGGFGNDFIITGEDSSETFGGTGNDFILGGRANEVVRGNEGDDWLQFGMFDGEAGDNFDPFAADTVIGHDVFYGDSVADRMDGEGGDDIMMGNGGQGDRYEGMSGFDWANFQHHGAGVEVDMRIRAFDETPLPQGSPGILTRFEAVEGLSGSAHSDILQGDDADAATIAAAGVVGHGGQLGSVLTNIDLIDGLHEFLNDLLNANVTSFGEGNIILGGGGSDIIIGGGGNDLIDGDTWLDVSIAVMSNLDGTGTEITRVKELTQLVPLMLDGTINPGQLVIIRELQDNVNAFGTDFDTARFTGNLADYTIVDNGDNTWTITDTVGTDGSDTIRNIERLQFADQSVVLGGLNAAPVGQPTINDTTPTEDQLLSVTIAGVTDADNVNPTNPTGAVTGPVSYFWQVEEDPGSGIFTDILLEDVPGAGGEAIRATGPTFRPGDAESGLRLRVRAVYQDANGVLEEVFSAPTALVANVNDAPTGAPTINDSSPTEGFALTVNPATIVDPDGTATAVAAGAFTFQWQQSVDGVVWTDIPGAIGQLFLPEQAQVGLRLRVAVTYVDDGGTTETAFSAATGLVGDRIFGTDAANALVGTAGQDEIWGLGGADNITGLAGNDTIFAGLGADRIDGGVGADTMWGEAGNDTYLVDNAGDQVIEFADEGIDTVQTLLASYTLADEVENLTLLTPANGGPLPGTSTTNFNWTGNASNNVITSDGGNDTLSGGAGNDTLNGNGGNDVLTGGADNDAVNGGAGNDRIVATVGDGNDTYNGSADIDTYDLSATAAGAVITNASASSAETGADTLVGIENFIGSQGDDTITVLGAVNVIDGQDGDDIIDAGGAADTVLGGLGDDTITGGIGNDNLSGGAGLDTFLYTMGHGADTIDGGADHDTVLLTGTAGNDTLDIAWNGTAITGFEGGTVTGVEAVTADLGAGTADRLSYAASTAAVSVDLAAGTASGFGSIAGVENVTGGSGNDSLSGAGNLQINNLAGGLGDDTYFADLGDTISEAADAGTDIVFTTSATFTLAANVENLTFTGVGNFTGNGNGSANAITGNAGNDVINGNGGDDTLVGNGGVDSLSGGAGNDTLLGGLGNDVMNGGTGNDIFLFADGFGNDTITGFDANATGGQDLLDMTALGIDAGSFAARVAIQDLGADTLVTIDGTDTILFVGVNGVAANAIGQDDFLLA
jgi:Ca2+-binding RTX toxin-like protein